MSVEQMGGFHIVRRILRAVAPDYRLLATADLPPGHSVLDVRLKTIEVGETGDVIEAISSLLFQIGHLLLAKDPAFDIFFGKNMDSCPKEDLLGALASLGVKADLLAYRWAVHVFKSYWSLKDKVVDDLFSKHVWTKEEWIEYFSVA